ncbi:hypothetical protein F5888DRAFT_821437 [Russula emetica]|nr:hypothetical protein F5888DRAFT_821437 [Russula emetica]
MPTVLSIVLSLFCLFLLQLFLNLRRIARDVGNLSGPYYLICPSTVLGRLIAQTAPPARYLNMGTAWALKMKHEEFAAAGQDAIAVITAFPRPSSIIYLADAAAIKEVTTSRARFPKPVNLYVALSVFGMNIVASEGEEWKKYRKIAAPAFSERNNALVWDETIRVMNDLFDNVWGDRPEIVVDQCMDITLPIALFVIGIAVTSLHFLATK